MEKKRNLLASRGRLFEFRNLYNNKRNELLDSNSSRFWDLKHQNEGSDLANSKIYIHKNMIVTEAIRNSRGFVLDLGIGNAYLEKGLKQTQNLRFFGVDISSHAIKKAQKQLRGVFKLGSILKIPFNDHMFDFVLALDVLEHIQPSSTFTVYSQINRVIKKNGTLIVSVPINEGLEQMLPLGINPNGHTRAYPENILKAELELSGFEISKIYRLYAFTKYYFVKTFLVNIIPFSIKRPNLIILIAKKK